MLLEKRLIAGTQITIVTSSFWWNGKIESKEEYKLEVRTRNDKAYESANLMESMHNYEVPEISSTSILCLTDKMKKWIDNSLS